MEKLFTAWNSCSGIKGLPAQFETLKEAQQARGELGGANRVTHADGRQWAAYMCGDNGYGDNPSSGWMQTANDWDLPENSNKKCVVCGANARQACLVYTSVPAIVVGEHPGGRVVASGFTRYYCEADLPTDLEKLREHGMKHCGNYPKIQADCPYCQRGEVTTLV